MTRREAREHCFKMLFSADFYPDREEAKEQLAQYADGPEEDDTDEEGRLVILHKTNLDGQEAERLTSRVREIMDRIPEIDSQIDQVAAGWKTRRMGKVELTILRLALYEMNWDESVPEKVAINEAVELAKKFGGKDSPAFVNGILARFAKSDQEPEA
ncbi:MAG TPA: transcription antitermination factor NusB [Candidatus Enterocloster faecavium]|uniref:Transcription antitermination protein NusB n=1 Tax=Candidatus Enterocloster faecavium TaxID=2838560 RepID=A0A9D2L6H6_9FIRM|nr:transcription antitermination factor NusB [Candidatus Enterocloster faecavium]